MNQLIFIYGTLRKGGQLEDVSSSFEVVAENILTDARAFILREFESVGRPGTTSPGMSRVETYDPDAGRVKGDIIIVPDIREMDKAEGFDADNPHDLRNKYFREAFQRHNGEIVSAYFVNAAVKREAKKPHLNIGYDKDAGIYDWVLAR